MPTITINDENDYLFYEDSGAPEGVDVYTTVVIVHGTGINGGIFKPLFPFASQRKLRLVSLNRRHFTGSSPFSQEELDALLHGDQAAHGEFLQKRAAELLKFIEGFVDKEDVPVISEDGRQGGISLMGWSSGNIWLLALFAFINKQLELAGKLAKYMRSYILFDPAHWVFGLPEIHAMNAMANKTYTLEERTKFFNEWISGHYIHPSITSRDLADLEYVTPNPDKPGTFDVMSKEDVDMLLDKVGFSAEILGRTMDRAQGAEHLRLAIFDDENARIWPGLQVTHIWCESSPYTCIYAYWGHSNAAQKYASEGIKGRPLSFVKMTQANHFVHWEEPERTMQVFGDILNS